MMDNGARDRLAEFLRSEKDQRPYWETDHRGMVMPLVKSGYNNSVSYGVPGILGGSAWGTLNDIIEGRQVAKGEIEQAAGDAAGAAMTGSFAFTRPMGAIPSGTSRPTGHPSGAPSPTEPHLARLEVGQQGHTGSGFGQQGPGSHTNWLNDPSLAEIASRYGLQKDGALSEPIARVLADPGNYEYGIRTTPYEVKPGSIMPDSAQWYQDANPVPWKNLTRDERDIVKDYALSSMSIDEIKARNWDPNYLDHGEPLGGSSAIGLVHPQRDVSPADVAGARGYRSYGVDGDYVHLVRSRQGKDGLDAGERVLPDAEVIAVAPFADGLFANAPTSAAAPSLQHIAKTVAQETPGIRAYHGSPHDFDKFDLSKIGTGEGAQAYGHGLYFAENEGVAGSYRTALSRAHGGWKFDGKPLEKPEDFWSLQKQLEDVEGNWRLNKLVNEFYSLRRQGYSKDEAIKNRKDWHRSDPEMQAAIDEFAKRSDMTEVPGRLYEVSIKADPEHFLDWDKPLSQQSEKVRAALNDTIQPTVQKWERLRASLDGIDPQYRQSAIDSLNKNVESAKSGGMSTGEYLDIIAPNRDYKEASRRLREAGIPGIKYLDQGSRGAGEGSRNYVVFSDDIVEILRKYGLAGLSILGGASAINNDPQSRQ